MKKYMLCFLHEDIATLEQALQDELDGGHGCFDWMSKLEEKKQYLDGRALHSTGIRISGKERAITDRTGSEIKELIGGFFLIKAENLEEATNSVQENYWEFGRGSTVEVREVMVFEE